MLSFSFLFVSSRLIASLLFSTPDSPFPSPSVHNHNHNSAQAGGESCVCSFSAFSKSGPFSFSG